MAKLEIDLVDTKTEDENHQREETKPNLKNNLDVKSVQNLFN